MALVAVVVVGGLMQGIGAPVPARSAGVLGGAATNTEPNFSITYERNGDLQVWGGSDARLIAGAFKARDVKSYGAAVRVLDELVARHPADPEVYLLRGSMQQLAGDLDAALGDFNQAVEREPDSVAARQTRASARLSHGEVQAALDDLQVAIQLAPRKASLYADRARCYLRQERFDLAQLDLNVALQIQPAQSDYLALRSQASGRQGNWVGALVDIQRALYYAPTNAAAFAERGLVLFNSGNYAAALADAERSLRLDSGLPAAYRVKGLALERLGYRSARLTNYLQMIAVLPEDPAARKLAAWQLATDPDPGLRDGRRAVTLAQEACRLSRWADSQCIDTLAAAYAETGDFDQALSYERQALARQPLDPATQRAMQLRLRAYQQHQPWRER